ncbi:S8 family serine peptidase, partial [candidate division KSB1 bacterium]|nr:S8 family serine peptidase [candidate division KSB1 bacterium]
MRRFFLTIILIIFGYGYPIHSQEILIKLKTNFESVESIELAKIDSAFAKFRLVEAKPLTPKSPSGMFGKLQKSRSDLYSKIGIDRWLIVNTSKQSDAQKLLNDLRSNPAIEHAQMNHVYHLHQFPDDPRMSEQWYIKKIQIDQAWEKTYGDPNMLIGIIDTGIDYDHEDLYPNLWINSGEDLNENGIIEPSDFNGIDDDNNGFIDDLNGWDFTDAPHFPDGGDYRERDNDPFDEHGHGTNVAGIVAAVANNSTGIAGVAPGCRMMNLRAGTSQGLLE